MAKPSDSKAIAKTNGKSPTKAGDAPKADLSGKDNPKLPTNQKSAEAIAAPPSPAAEAPPAPKPFSEVMQAELAQVKQQQFTQGRIDAMKLLVGQQAYREGFTETVQAVGVTATPEEAERFRQTVTLTPGIDYDSVPSEFDPRAILASVSNEVLSSAESTHALSTGTQA